LTPESLAASTRARMPKRLNADFRAGSMVKVLELNRPIHLVQLYAPMS
jgi:hypothetical protein